MTRRLLTCGALGCLAVGVVGCADPYTHAREQPTTTVPGQQRLQPLPAQPDDAPSAAPLPASPDQAVRRAADLAYTWTARTAAPRQAALAAISTGQARRDALQAAARLPTDPQLAAGDAASTTPLAAIALPPGSTTARGSSSPTSSLVANGIHQDRWRVTLVTAVRLVHGWAISRWEPQE